MVYIAALASGEVVSNTNASNNESTFLQEVFIIKKEITHNMFREYPDVVDADVLAEMLGISKKLTYRLLSEGKINSVRIGRRYKIPKVFVVEYLIGQNHSHT